MGHSVTSKVDGLEAKNVDIKDKIIEKDKIPEKDKIIKKDKIVDKGKIVERGVVGTVKKYKGWKEAGVILRNEASKPNVKFHRDDIHEWQFVDFKTLVGRAVTFDLTVGNEAKNVRLVG